MKNFINEIVTMIMLAAFGGFVRTLAAKRREDPYNWRIAIAEIIIAIFAGILVHLILSNYPSISDNFRAAIVALSGYSARGILNVLNTILLNRLKNFKIN